MRSDKGGTARGKAVLLFAAGLVAGILVCALNVPAIASQLTKALTVRYRDIKIYVNGEQKVSTVTEPFIVVDQGYTYVPLRFVSESLGYTVDWDDSTSSIYISGSSAQAAAVSGYVRDSSSGVAIANATVTLVNASSGQTVATATSNANGYYTLTGVAAGNYRIDISAANYTAGSLTAFTVAAGGSYSKDAALSLTTAGTVTISGYVRDLSGSAVISGATVKLVNSVNGQTVQTVVTNANGYYTMAGVAAGSYRIDISAANYTAGSLTAFTVAAGGSYSKDAALSLTNAGTATISGYVSNSSGTAFIANATVTLVNAVNGQIVKTAVTNSSGYYTLTGVAAGSYRIDISAANYTAGSLTAFTVTAGASYSKDAALSLTNAGTATISGYVTNSATRTAVNGASVKLINSGGQIAATVTANSSGYYTFSGVAAGAYTIEISAPNFATGTVTSFTAASGGTYSKDIALNYANTATIAGYILDASGGAGVNGATVRLVNSANGQIVQTVSTDNSGYYSFGGVAPGTYGIDISAAGYVLKSIPAFNVTAGDSYRKNDSIVRANNNSVTGYITDSTSGAAVGGASISLVNSQGQTVAVYTTNIYGYYVFTGVADGNYTISVSASGYVAGYVAQFSLSGANTVARDLRLVRTVNTATDFSGFYTSDRKDNEGYVSSISLGGRSGNTYQLQGSIKFYDRDGYTVNTIYNLSGSITFQGDTGTTAFTVTNSLNQGDTGTVRLTIGATGAKLYVTASGFKDYYLDATYFS